MHTPNGGMFIPSPGSQLSRLAHFLAQISVESGYGKWKKELGGEAYFTRLYWDKQKKAKELGNESKEDAIRYSGSRVYGLPSSERCFFKASDAFLCASSRSVLWFGVPDLAFGPILTFRLTSRTDAPSSTDSFIPLDSHQWPAAVQG